MNVRDMARDYCNRKSKRMCACVEKFANGLSVQSLIKSLHSFCYYIFTIVAFITMISLRLNELLHGHTHNTLKTWDFTAQKLISRYSFAFYDSEKKLKESPKIFSVVRI